LEIHDIYDSRADMEKRVLLFDLDGTLTDPVEGITRSIQYTLRKLRKPAPDAEDLHWCIGPPLVESLKRILGDTGSGQVQEALLIYRERFSKIGKFENKVYDGIPEVLSLLNETGFSLFVATSKPTVYAIDIIKHFDLAPYFNRVYGSELNGDLVDKTELINHIISNEGINKNRVVMIGDRRHDIIGAKNNGLASIGVTYGYGTREELLDSGADWLATSPSDILNILS
jgi:phosphoglycolate phosphatase